MAKRLFIVFTLLISLKATPQYFEKERELISAVEKASSDSDKIKTLNALAEFYYIYHAEDKGDSILNKQLLIAELSSDRRLIWETLFSRSFTNVSTWSSSEMLDKALSFADKGLSYSRETNRKDFEIIAHLRKSFLLRKRTLYDQAIHHALQAFALLESVLNDSLKSQVYMELGSVYLNKGDAVSAYKNYNNAYDIAYALKNIPLQSEILHKYSEVYQSLGNLDLAKQNLFKSLELNKKFNNEEGMLKDYIDLGRLTDEIEYFKHASHLADKLNIEQYKLYSKRLFFAYYMVIEKNSKKTYDYLLSNEDLKQSYLNKGIDFYYWNVGNIFKYANEPDSALHYYLITEPTLEKKFDPAVRMHLNSEIGECYIMKHDWIKAIQYIEDAHALAIQTSNLDALSDYTFKLSDLYAQLKDYDKAYSYNQRHLKLKDSLLQLNKQRDLVLLSIERENNQHQADLEEMKREELRIRNLQYMGISIAISILFMMLILFGMFTVPKFIIRMIGFIAFICLFEFIILLIDNYVHHAVHGDALYIWLIKIGVLAILFPSHHYLEHKMVHFIESKKLMKFKEKISIQNFITKNKKPIVKTAGMNKETTIET